MFCFVIYCTMMQILQDDAKQAAKANSLVLGTDEVLITDVVMTETISKLKGKRYVLSKEQVIDVIHALICRV